MHISFIDYFVDPETKEALTLEVVDKEGDFIETGTLKSSTNRYPIIREIPRFIPYKEDNYSSSFGKQWHRWPKVQFESENKGKSMEGHTLNMWQRITGINLSKGNLKNSVITEIGCGPGRFIEVVASAGAKVIGIDLSSAVEIAEQNFKKNKNICICQGDALKLPFKGQSLDGSYSIGVLHHTPSPKKCIKEIYKSLKEGAWFAVSVYRKGGYYDWKNVQLYRKLFNVLDPLFKHYPPLIYTYCTVYLIRPLLRILPLLGKCFKKLFPFIDLPDTNWSLLDTYDSITPSFQSGHESFEVFTWFKDNKFKHIEPTNWGSTSYRAMK